jgi:hypothetical protein
MLRYNHVSPQFVISLAVMDTKSTFHISGGCGLVLLTTPLLEWLDESSLQTEITHGSIIQHDIHGEHITLTLPNRKSSKINGIFGAIVCRGFSEGFKTSRSDSTTGGIV